jgi:acetyltransferase-like isoleucine patch superfamily enzyme
MSQFNEIRIGEGTWVGYRTSIMDGVSIGKFCVIGANSVVTRDVPDGCVAGGVPARVIKTAKPD